jgi:hypothetical protein
MIQQFNKTFSALGPPLHAISQMPGLRGEEKFAACAFQGPRKSFDNLRSMKKRLPIRPGRPMENSSPSKSGADHSIMILPSAGAPATQLTPFKGEQWSNGWSPDGDKVLFAKQEDDWSWNIWWVSRSTKIETQLTRYTNRNALVRYPRCLREATKLFTNVQKRPVISGC